ncbi:nuclear receptor ROR-beta-like [Crassostrea virginica]
MSEGKVISDEKQCPFDGGTTEDKSTVTNRVFGLAKHSGKNQRTETEESSMSGTEKPIEKLKVKKQRRKRDKYLPNTAPLELPPCKICRKAASGIHYGINSCEACKGFFRRYLKRNEPYRCTRGGNCVIGQSPTGYMCSGCRLQKCFSLGMSKEGIRQGRYTLQERTNAIIEMRKRQDEQATQARAENSVRSATQLYPSDYHNGSSSMDVYSDSSILSGHPSASSSPSSSSQLLSQSSEGSSNLTSGKIQPTCFSSDHPSLKFHIGNSPNLNQSQPIQESIQKSKVVTADWLAYESSMASLPALDTSDNLSQGEEDLGSFCSSMEKLMEGYNELKPFTKSLSDDEIHALLNDGFQKYSQKIQLFGSMDPLPANTYNEIFKVTDIDVDGRTKILALIRTELVTVIHEYVKFTHGIPAFKKLLPGDQASLLKAARLEFFLLLGYRSLDPETGMMVSYTGHVLPIKQFCAYAPADMSTSWLEVSRHIRHLQLLPKEHATMLGICLTFTDRCSLEDPGTVEKIQVSLLRLLESLLKERYGKDGGKQLSKIMDVFVKLRGLNEEFLMLYRKICQDKFLIEHLPELLQFLFDE